MKYRDLIQFESVTEVIQLLKADQKETARTLVATYVISDRMADVLLHRILPALDLADDSRSRGLFIVGNYGTGKSHLMAMVSAIAEHADLLEKVKHPAVKKEMSAIAGKFKVVRQETAATKMALRDVVFTDLERQLKNMGVDFHFPPMTEAASNKLLLADMMKVFQKVYPDHGLLIVLDELLDYLKARDEKEIIMDLNFLREVGEACENMPLRFISGIQEALFDNPRFAFVADSIKRVKSRFDQASIVREDVAYVVSHRLLNKTEHQKDLIRKHLEIFTPLYTEMAERLDDFVELFPVHPSYLEIFEQVSVGERRDLLKALSTEMGSLLDKDVPPEEPGLITFDSYWRLLSEDDSFRTIPDVRNVQDKARVLSDKVSHASETKDYRATALRIIDGLALYRLTVSDIYAPIGITPAELRDRLCIFLPLPEMDADFLLATIETILKAISTAVNGQFISHNTENDQYYLDLKKDIDFEALIQQKADTLSQGTLDRYYFELVKALMEISESSYVSGFRIWDKEIPWMGHGITRRGYLFLGASNERSTAHPERDFYIHFHGVYGNGIPERDRKPDEVFFKPTSLDEPFKKTLRLYAGAAEMSAISSGSNRDQYETKTRVYQGVLLRWLRENFIRGFQLVHERSTLGLTEAIAQYRLNLRDLPFRDQVHRLAGVVLEAHFSAKHPQYPRFEGVELNSLTLMSAAENALRAIMGGQVTRLAQSILEGLQIGQLENSRMIWNTGENIYVDHFQQLVDELDPGKVINRLVLLEGEPGAERDKQFGLEPELLAVLLAFMVRQGAIALNLRGLVISDLDATNGDRLKLDQLLTFTSISKPKAIPEQAVRELFSALKVAPELLDDPRTRELGMTQFQEKLGSELSAAVRMGEALRTGPRFAHQMIFEDQEQQKLRKKLDDYQRFLQSLTSLTSYARLANLSMGIGEIRAGFKAREVMYDLDSLNDTLRIIQPDWEYLGTAQGAFAKDDPWTRELIQAIEQIILILRNKEKRSVDGLAHQLHGRLENLQSAFIKRYFELHQAARLDREQDQRKSQLAADPRWLKLRALSTLDLLPSRELNELEDKLRGLRSCPNLTLADLKIHSACPYCGFMPIQAGDLAGKHASLDEIESDLAKLVERWVDVLMRNLETPEAAASIKLLDRKEKEGVEDFINNRSLPEKISTSFLDGVKYTLQGLEILQIDGTDFLFALTEPGTPCTADELEKRIREFLQKHLEGKDRRKLRIHINW